MLEKTLESPFDCKGIQPVHPKGNQPWIFVGRTDAEAPKLWPPDEKNWLTGKDPDAGKDWRQEEKGTTEDGITDSMDMSLSKLRESVMVRQAWHVSVHEVTKSWTQLSKWSECSFIILVFLYQTQGSTFSCLFIFPFLLTMLSFYFPWYCKHMPFGSWPHPQHIDSLIYSMKIPHLIC